MSWLEDITSSIKYIEGHLTDELTLEKIAAKINLSPFYFQKGFSILCGITVSEYIRNRRLSLAGRDLQTDGVKVIDVAMKYGYDSPDSFTKAFTRFHGITPAQAKSGDGELKNYLPLRIHVSMKGGFEMECKIVKKPAFTVVGSAKIIKNEEGYKECPQFWTEHYEKENGKYICGMYGICLDDGAPEGFFKYMIADDYIPSKDIPEEFETVVIPENTWEQKISDVVDNDIDVFVMGHDWEGKFDFLKEYCEVVYLPRTEGISTTKIKKDLGLKEQEKK